ncbi:MAG: GNAT family N-acetyltransferase [Proteobacteria bacterium]|nr:GNAT family N-acetyltransferase [Pseudomonadota bacterium]
MGAEFRLETERLVLRDWRDDDAPAHQAMCHDPRVAAMLGSVPSEADSRAVVQRQQAFQRELGHCFWALEPRSGGGFAGWCGIKPGKAPIEGQTEIGWSLRPDLWGQGLASEAAAAALAWGWGNLPVAAITAITSRGNHRSRAVMVRLGMVHCPAEDFDHPDLAAGHPLRAHVLYRAHRPEVAHG